LLSQIKLTAISFLAAIVIALMHSMGIYPGPVIVPEAEKKALVRNRALLPLFLSRNRKWLQDYFTRYKSFPILKNARFNFWDFRTSQFLWMDDFHTLIDVPAGPEGKISKVEPSWKITDPETKGLKTPGEKEFLFLLGNPISGKFDWLAEDASGTLYSPNMPDSVLIASPPIRVVNIRCPVTASDPPYFEDFTKW